MRKLHIAAAVGALSVMLGGLALADERTTGSATLVDPATHAYVGTFVQNCASPIGKSSYVGVYLGQPIQVEGKARLSLLGQGGTAFTTSPRAIGEEGWLSEAGGQSKMGCLPVGSTVLLVSMPLGPEGPIRVLGTGTVH